MAAHINVAADEGHGVHAEDAVVDVLREKCVVRIEAQYGIPVSAIPTREKGRAINRAVVRGARSIEAIGLERKGGHDAARTTAQGLPTRAVPQRGIGGQSAAGYRE